MKTLIKILFFFLLVMQICFAQWFYQSPIPSVARPEEVCFINSDTGWTVSDNTILKTTDGGNNWIIHSTGINGYFEGIFFIDANTGWAVGTYGIIVKTTNGGDTWIRKPYPNMGSDLLKDVFFIDANKGWIAAGNAKILRTTDGGESWITTQGKGGFEVFFIDENRGWTAGGATINRTTDGGQSWVTQTTNYQLYGLHFANASTGWAVGVDDILKTTDGGENWVKQVIDTSTNVYLESVCFTDVNSGVIVGCGVNGRINEILILRTTDGGISWIKHFTGIVGWWNGLSSVCFPTPNIGIAVGGCSSMGRNTDGPIILRTEDGGESWFSQVKGTNNVLNGIASIDENTATAVGWYGTIMRTTNGGNSWIRQLSGTVNDLNDVYFTDANNGTAVGGDWYQTGGIILGTTDGGNSWVNQLEDSAIGFNGIYFINDNTGWVVGGSGTILKTTNSGNNWISQSSGTTIGLNSVQFASASIGWVVGGNGTILKTTNGGSGWISQGSGTTNSLGSVYFTSANTGWVVGGSGTILKTTNSGNNWISQSSGTTIHLNSVFFTDSNTGWAVGDPMSNGGIILITTDGGNNWTQQTGATLDGLNAVSFASSTTGWAVGYRGTILKTTNGGVIPVELNLFTASAKDKEVTLNWSTATELNNQGFDVQRKFGSNDFATIGSAKGHGTTTSPNNYTYVDKLIDAGKYFYRLKQTDFGGKFEYSQIVEVSWSPFTTYKLEQNFSNPFNPTTTIGFGIPEKGNVRLSVLNILGEEIKVLLNEEKEAGYHSVDFNASDLPSSVYFYRLQSGNFIDTKKMILLK